MEFDGWDDQFIPRSFKGSNWSTAAPREPLSRTEFFSRWFLQNMVSGHNDTTLLVS